MEQSTEMEFRYTPDADRRIGAAMGSLSALGYTMSGSLPPWQLLAVWLFWGATVAAVLLVDHLRCTRGRVRLTDGGFVAHDWRGRDLSADWAGISEMRVDGAGTWFWRSGSWYHRLRLRDGQGRWLRVGPRLGRAAPLTEEIVARAGLTDRSVRWWGTVYRRPGPV